MKSCFSLLLLVSINGFCQFNQEHFNTRREVINRQAMVVLGGWAAANIIWGTAGTATTSGSQKSFHQMNLGWGIINGAIAGVALLKIKKQNKAGLNFAETIRAQQKIEKLYLINAGLDLAYLGAGAWMLEKSKTNTSKAYQWKGFGNSLLMQGTRNSRHGKLFDKQLDKLQITAGIQGVGIQWGI